MFQWENDLFFMIFKQIDVLNNLEGVQCPHSEEEYSVATICGFEDEFQNLKA